MLNDLLLLSGNDIPFPEAQVTIHQPTIKEISYIGEESFFIGCGFLDFSKDLLDPKDKIKLADYDDFDIFMTIMTSGDRSVVRNVECATLVLTLIFPLYIIEVRKDCIVLKQDEKEFFITKKNFSNFKKIIAEMFSLHGGKNVKEEYNPEGDMAARIAEKFKKRHEQLLKISVNKKTNKFSVLGRYISILAIGLPQDINSLMSYTICQLYDAFQRFQLKLQWDAYLQARMAGAQDLEEVDNWMIDLQEQGKNKNNKIEIN